MSELGADPVGPVIDDSNLYSPVFRLMHEGILSKQRLARFLSAMTLCTAALLAHFLPSYTAYVGPSQFLPAA